MLDRVQPIEIDVRPVQHIRRARFEGEHVECIHIVHVALRDVDDGGDVAAEIEQGMHLNGALALVETGPRKEG